MLKRDTKLQFCFISCKENESFQVDNGPAIPDHEDSEEESADKGTSRDSLIPHEAQGNGREGSLEGSKRGEGLIDAVINHIYEKPPNEYAPSFEELSSKDEARLILKTRARTWKWRVHTKESLGIPQRGPLEMESAYMSKRSQLTGLQIAYMRTNPTNFVVFFRIRRDNSMRFVSRKAAELVITLVMIFNLIWSIVNKDGKSSKLPLGAFEIF